MKYNAKPRADRLITAEEFERMPEEDGYRVELVRGVLVREPQPGSPHGLVESYLARLLWNWAIENDAGVVTTGSGYILERDPDTVRGPDVSFLSKPRKPAWPVRAWWEIGPDLAVEVLSPSNTRAYVKQKIEMYFAAGSRLVWVIDARKRQVTIYRPGSDPTIHTGNDDLAAEDVLPGFSVTVREIFEIL